MISERILLSPEEIYEKEFKIDARGYRPQEVDNLLDDVIKDYGEFIKIIHAYEKEYQNLSIENKKLKAEIRRLETKLDEEVSNGSTKEVVSNVDLLRRISQLEKYVYGKE